MTASTSTYTSNSSHMIVIKIKNRDAYIETDDPELKDIVMVIDYDNMMQYESEIIFNPNVTDKFKV